MVGDLYKPGEADSVPDDIPDVDRIPEPVPRDEPRSRYGNRSYKVLGKRYEVLDGKLHVSPSPTPRHQRAVGELERTLHPYVSSNALGEVFHSPADMEFNEQTLVQPDVFIAPEFVTSWRDMKAPVLVIEVLSSSTARVDRINKRRIYQEERIPEYWIVDIEGEIIERWRPDDSRPEVLSNTISWQPRPDVSPLTIDLLRFFRTVLTGER